MPSIAVTRKYEACYILKPDTTDDLINATIQRYKHVVENAGGVIEKTGIWERRRLAYEIKGYTEGIFVLLNFSGEATVEAELRRIFQISIGEDQIRYIIVKQEEGETAKAPVELTERIQRGPAPVPAAVPVEAVAAPAPVTVAVEAPDSEPVEVIADAPAIEAEAPAEPVQQTAVETETAVAA